MDEFGEAYRIYHLNKNAFEQIQNSFMPMAPECVRKAQVNEDAFWDQVAKMARKWPR